MCPGKNQECRWHSGSSSPKGEENQERYGTGSGPPETNRLVVGMSSEHEEFDLEQLGQPIDPWDDEKLTSVARSLITREAYVAWIGTRDFDYAFGLLMALLQLSDMPRNMVGMIGYMSDALPRAINGVPMFTSATAIPQESADALMNKYDEMADALGLPHARMIEADDEDWPVDPDSNPEGIHHDDWGWKP